MRLNYSLELITVAKLAGRSSVNTRDYTETGEGIILKQIMYYLRIRIQKSGWSFVEEYLDNAVSSCPGPCAS